MSDEGIPQIDIEKEFAACVRKIGGQVLSDRFGPSPLFENADYAFLSDGVIAELKCLQRDTRTEKTFKERVTDLYMEWVRKRLVPPLPRGKLLINSANIPPECATQIRNILVKRLARIVEKANNQIKATKQALGTPDAKGLLLLANDGDTIFEVEMVLWALHHILNGKYNSINRLVYFTANLPVVTPSLPTPALMWLHPRTRRPSGRPLEPPAVRPRR